MPPVWKERLARVRQANDANFGEAFSATPTVRDQYVGSTPDPDRPAFSFTGILKVTDGERSGLARPANEDIENRPTVGDTILHVDPDTYPAIIGLTVGDVVSADDRGGVRYEISRVDRRMRNRLVFRLMVLP
jgi:hypothetical protein